MEYRHRQAIRIGTLESQGRGHVEGCHVLILTILAMYPFVARRTAPVEVFCHTTSTFFVANGESMRCSE